MSIDTCRLREVLSQYATGITVVTTSNGKEIQGITVNAFCSVSLNPPLLLVCIHNDSYCNGLIKRHECFAVNILSESQEAIAKKFANNQISAKERFAELEYRSEKSGAPVLEDAIGWLDCRLVKSYPGGDHTIFLGEVLALGDYEDKSPLLFYRRKYEPYNGRNS